MKKLKTFTRLGLSALTACAVLTPLSVHAANTSSSCPSYTGSNGNVRFVVLNGTNCDLSELFCNLNLPDCFSGNIAIPDCNTEQPDSDSSEKK